ncbi:MAG: sigma-70 family RNA polymerase sigma factor [Ruminococcaceae bacterium]|nr:sigma-70 family RNA polymerase sigma factor [Oscillospiraceae bacterium]
MLDAYLIAGQVYAAKKNMQKADDLIKAYIPFIKNEASKYMSRPCTDQDDEFSIAMIAFHEAIQGYFRERGAFLSYASLIIRSRLIDYSRKEMRHQGHLSLDDSGDDEDNNTLHGYLADKKDEYTELANLEATKQEIQELSDVMVDFGISLMDVTDNSPKQQRTLEACRKAVQYGIDNPAILDEMLRTRKLPLSKLVKGSGVERKTLERHRKYVLAMLIIQTNGYEIIRGHLRHLSGKKGGGRA